MSRWSGRVIAWATKAGARGAKVAHAWVVSVKDPGVEVTVCGKQGERATDEMERDGLRTCTRCADRVNDPRGGLRYGEGV